MAEKLRVLLATGTMAGGGSERQIIEILKHLDRSRFEPLLYLIYRQGELLREIPTDVPVFSYWQRHRQPRIHFPGRIHLSQARDLARVVREQQVDVVYDRTYFMTLVAARATRYVPVPRISVIVSDPQYDLTHQAERFRIVKQWLLRRAYRRADQVVAVSEGVRQAASQFYGLAPHRIRTIYNLLDVQRIEQLAREPPPLDVADDRFRIVTAGRLDRGKGFHFLLDAVAELVHRRQHKLSLWILGQGAERGALESYVTSRQLGRHVQLLGYLPNPFPLFRAASLYCLPSLHEGLPNVLLEAMACELPVLATDCPSGPREILADGRYGTLVPPADAAALADAIEDAISRFPEWQLRATQAKTHVEQTFSVTRGISRLEDLLESLGGRRV